MGPSAERAAWLARHVLPHEPLLRSWLRPRTPHDLEIDDVIQETYAALAALSEVDHIGTPRAYVFRTAQCVILQHRRRARLVRFEILDGAHPAEAPSPEQQSVAQSELRRTLSLMDQLPPKCRQAFALRKLEGLSQREIALRMGIAESTVEKHVSRGLQFLMTATGSGPDGAPEPISSAAAGDCAPPRVRHAAVR